MVLANNYFLLSIVLVFIALAESYQNKYMIFKQKVRCERKKQQIILGDVLSDYKLKATYEKRMGCDLECNKNEYCYFEKDLEEQSCVCKDGFIPTKYGEGCEKKKNEKAKLCNNNDGNFVQCFIYDDTSFTAFDSTDYEPFGESNTTRCQWLVSADSCDGPKSKYRVNVRTGLVENKVIVNEVIIRYGKMVYSIGDELKVNGEVQNLPYKNFDDDFFVEMRAGMFIVVNVEFNIRFLKNAILNYGTCDATSCGICGEFSGENFIEADKKNKKNKFMIDEDGTCKSDFKHMMKDEI